MFARMPNRFLLGMAALCLAGTAACSSATKTGSATEPAKASKAGLGDYHAMRKIREKHGLDIFTTLADPSLKEVIWSESDSPNLEIRNDLSQAQLAACDKALTSCRAQAVQQITGRVVRSTEDWAEQRNQMIRQTLDREVNGDPELVELAAAMGDCLRGKGHRVGSLKPSDIGTQVAHQFEEQLKRTALSDDIPEKGMRDGEYFMPHLAPATAMQYATKEVKAALDDLECGRNFYAAYEPRNKEISERVTQLFGGGPL